MVLKLKVYELAKELGVENQNLVDVVQRLGIDIKNPMSVLGTEEVRSIREYYRKNRPLPTKSASAPAITKPGVTEKRVGATVIRRRAKGAPAVDDAKVDTKSVDETVAPVDADVEMPVVVEAPEEEAAAVETEVVEKAVPEAPKIPTRKIEITPPPRRKLFPSIIKKVATETYLGATVGPKPEKKLEPAKVAGKDETSEVKGGPKRLKEVEILAAPATDASKDSKRRTARTDSVFKSADYLKRELIHATKKKKTGLARPLQKTQITTPAEHKRVVEMGEKITVADLAKGMGVKGTAVIPKLMNMGVTASLNETVDYDTAVLVSHEFGFEVKQQVFKESDFIPAAPATEGPQEPRPPVVTIMGHVDHGKTSLLDAIRKTDVAAGEAGGITQHIGAYMVTLPKGRIAFLDTPGHEAFTAMRARGAKVTDLVVLVVSGVDGVMPQTLESVAHAKAAEVPIIVAINKTDLPEANPDRVKQTLAGHGLNPEEWGGDTLYVNVSAKTRKGIDTLLENILLQSEMLELKASHAVPASGTVIESKLDKNKGPLATILVQQGVLKRGDTVVCGQSVGKIRAMSDWAGKRIEEASPSEPVEVMGLSTVPNVGDEITAALDEKRARELVELRQIKSREKQGDGRPKATLEQVLAAATVEKELRIILKADVQGSTEALREAIGKLPQDKVKAKLLHASTGGITESDVMLAAASGAVIVGFNVRPDLKAQQVADMERVQLRTYSIIYDMLDDLKKFLEGMLGSEVQERVIGRAEVRNVFHITKIGTIAGSAIIDGKVQRGCFLRLLRDSRVVYEGKLSSLKRFKEDVKEVAQGFECGIGLENFNDVKMGDHFEAYVKEEVKRSL
ncbi:MAG: translation initiation factor IF-2 [Deltaproteobacteria bacterium]|nr:translation initiation factor IF-2 [Deltaproteobacteria bacterium]